MSIRRIFCCLIGLGLILLPALCQAPAPLGYTITNFAGNGTSTNTEDDTNGDGSAATSAELFDPWGMAFDSSGNLYIADQLHNKIRKIAADGTISTIAGDGTASYAGDNEAATSASLNHPTNVAVDSSGNVYVADSSNHVIRKVEPTGTIRPVAGTGTSGFDATEASDEELEATSALLSHPLGLAISSSGEVYFADCYNHRIRKVDADGFIRTVAGDGTAGSGGDGDTATKAELNYPQGIAFDAAGNLYIADTMNGLIRKVATDGTISTVAGVGGNGYFGDGGPATSAGLDYPKSVLVDGAGNLFIVDSFSNRVRLVTASDGVIRTVAGNGVFGELGDGGPALKAQFRFPSGIAQDAAGNLYVSDTQNNRVRLLTPVTQPSAPQSTPAIHTGGVVSASAFGAFRAVAPGSWIEIYGSNLATSSRIWRTSDFSGLRAPTALGGTRVTIGGVPAFLSYVSATQINALVPSNVPTGEQQIKVVTSIGTSSSYAITVNATEPGLYSPPTFKIAGRQYAAALLDGGGAFVLPSGALAGTVTRRARPGDTLVLFGVGFGPVTPAVNAGEIVQGANSVNAPVEFRLGGTPAAITYRGLVPGSIGVYQFNVVVPQIPAGDAVPLAFTLGGQRGTQTLYTAVEN